MMTKTANTAQTDTTGQTRTTARAARGSGAGHHTQASYRVAKAQGRVRHPSYPASRVAGLKHEPKLTAEDAHEIRRTYRYRSHDANMRVLAERFGVSVATIFKIIRGKMWRFTATANAPQSCEPRNHMMRLTKKARANIESMMAALATLDPTNPEVRALIRRYEITAHANAVR